MDDLTTSKRLLVIFVVLLIGAAVSLAGGDGGVKIGTISLFAICGIIAFLVNWIAFIQNTIMTLPAALLIFL